MGRAYLRLDPGFFDRKAVEQDYPPGAIACWIGVLCLADSQPVRGVFRSRKLLVVLLGSRYARWIPYLIAHRDLLVDDTGRVTVDGWDVWQEGDLSVPDRMRLYRAKRAGRNPVTSAVTPTVTPTVTKPDITPRSAKSDSEAKAKSRAAARATTDPLSSTDRAGVAAHQVVLDALTDRGLTLTSRQLTMLRSLADQEQTSRADVASGWSVLLGWINDTRPGVDVLAQIKRLAKAARRARAEAPPAGGRRRAGAKVRPDMAAAAAALAKDLAAPANGAPKPSVDRDTAIAQLREVRGKVNEPAWSQLLARYGLSEADLAQGEGG